jgi:K+-transporting ATPase KdpF subunit
MFAAARSFERSTTVVEYLVVGLISLAVTVYLIYALLRPERF